jgi:glycine cleavage system H protein
MTVKYTEDHEWLKIEGDIATVGITVHAQDALGDVVFVDLPAVGTTFAQKETAGVVESVKAAADVYMPVSGEVTAINEALKDDPSLANSDPMGAGWFFKIKLSDPSQLDALMDETRYTAFAAYFPFGLSLSKPATFFNPFAKLRANDFPETRHVDANRQAPGRP